MYLGRQVKLKFHSHSIHVLYEVQSMHVSRGLISLQQQRSACIPLIDYYPPPSTNPLHIRSTNLKQLLLSLIHI